LLAGIPGLTNEARLRAGLPDWRRRRRRNQNGGEQVNRHAIARRFATIGLVVALGQVTASAAGDDTRISLGLTASERVQFLAEMRVMLASIQGVVAGIGVEDRDRIAAAARQSGNRMSRATPEQVRRRLPEEFKAMGGPTHLLFEELAIRAETDDMQSLTALTGELLTQCVSCHAKYRAD
jgi:hypothetical protein